MKLAKKFKFNVKTILLIAIFIATASTSTACTIKYFKNKKYAAIQKHDDTLAVINNLIWLSEICQDKGKTESDINATSLKFENTANTLRRISSHNGDPIIHEIALISENLGKTFEQEAQFMIAREIATAVFNLNRTIDTVSIQKMRIQSMQNAKTIEKSMEDLIVLSSEFILNNKAHLTEEEKIKLSEEVYSKFETAINKFQKQYEKSQDMSKILMRNYEYIQISIYGALIKESEANTKKRKNE